MRLLHYILLHVTLRANCLAENVILIVIIHVTCGEVSNETQHERNIAYSCNTKSLNCVLEQLPNINRIFFWSDGCAS